jgi:hypothetical protein
MTGAHRQPPAVFGSPSAPRLLLPGRRVYLGHNGEPGTITRCISGNPADPRRQHHMITRYDVLLDEGFHATNCPAIDVAPQQHPADCLSQDTTAIEAMAQWIARTRGQLTDYDNGGVVRTTLWQAATVALHEIDLARWGRENLRCPFTWPSSTGEVLGCAFHAEPGRGLCGIHLRVPAEVLHDPIHQQRPEVTVTTVDPIGEHAPKRMVTA